MGKLITSPLHGWSHFTFDEKARISYVDPFPEFVLLEGIESLKENKPFQAEFDAEGYYYQIFSDDTGKMFLLILDDKSKKRPLNCDFLTFFKDLLSDIEEDFEGWASFFYSPVEDKEEYEKTKEKLRNLLDEAEELYEKKVLEKLEEKDLER